MLCGNYSSILGYKLSQKKNFRFYIVFLALLVFFFTNFFFLSLNFPILENLFLFASESLLNRMFSLSWCLVFVYSFCGFMSCDQSMHLAFLNALFSLFYDQFLSHSPSLSHLKSNVVTYLNSTFLSCI